MGLIGDVLSAYGRFAMITVYRDKSKAELYVESNAVDGDTVKAYLGKFQIKADCFDVADGVVVRVAKNDRERAKALLRAWGKR